MTRLLSRGTGQSLVTTSISRRYRHHFDSSCTAACLLLIISKAPPPQLGVDIRVFGVRFGSMQGITAVHAVRVEAEGYSDFTRRYELVFLIVSGGGGYCKPILIALRSWSQTYTRPLNRPNHKPTLDR